MKRFIFITILLSGVLLAQGALALTISPPKIELDANPGSIINQTIKLFNETEEARIFYPAVQDFTARGETGEPGFVAKEKNPYSLADWIKIDIGPIALSPKERKEIQFTVQVPENAEPGGRYAGILFSTQPPEVMQGATPIAVAGKVGSLVLLRVGGEVVEFGRLVEFDTKDQKDFYTHLPIDFYIRFENLGNVHLKPQGEVKLQGLLDITATPTTLLVNEAGGNALPQSIRRYDVSWTKPGVKAAGVKLSLAQELKHQWKGFAIGKFTARLNLYYGTEARQMTAEKSFWVFPWLLILVIAVVAAVLAFGLKIGIKKYNAWIIRRSRIR